MRIMSFDFQDLADPFGVILRREVIAIGGDDRTIQRAMRAGQIVRIRHGAYCLARVWDSLDQVQRHLLRARVTIRASKTDVVLSHVSAVALHGAPTWDLPLDEIHLTRTDRRGGRREANVAQHRGCLSQGDVMEGEGIKVTTPTRTCLDLTTVVSLHQAVPVLDHFLHAQATTKSALRAGAAQMNLWANTLGTGVAIAAADGRRESVGESRTALMLRGSGIPTPIPQYEIHDERGRLVARVDFAWPELGAFLEFDGRVKYERLRRDGEDVVDTVLREKKREELICRLTGWRCIRVTWDDLNTPERTLRWIASVLRGARVHA